MSDLLRLVELYSSVQGEGPRTGVITTFVRFGGCNMRCPLWPCDTQYAIDPKQWKDSPLVTYESIVSSVRAQAGANVCLTGGEPTMQPKDELEQLARRLLHLRYTIDLFTNGSAGELPAWVLNNNVCIVFDWKLAGSGEADRGFAIRKSNVRWLGSKDCLKFTIASDADFDEAREVWFRVGTPPTIAGVVWGAYPNDRLVERIRDHDLPWRLNLQAHKYIYPDAVKGV